MPLGRRLGDDRLEVLVLLVALGELLRVAGNWAAVEYPQREQEEKSRGGNQNWAKAILRVTTIAWTKRTPKTELEREN